MTTGYEKNIKPVIIPTDKNGIIHITVPQDERMVLDLRQPRVHSYIGYMKVNRELRKLPPGASMDTKSGMFYWQPGPASFGKYHLVFLTKTKTGMINKIFVTIEITPKFIGNKVERSKSGN
jgi:hypothetical protein